MDDPQKPPSPNALKIYIVNGGGEMYSEKNLDRIADVITHIIMRKIDAIERDGDLTRIGLN
jgi:hypothetical protein